MLATAAIVHLVCKHTKLKALLTGIAFQLVKQIEAIFDNDRLLKHCTVQWYTIAALTLNDCNSYNLYLFEHTKMHYI